MKILEDGLKSGTITKQTQVTVGMESELYRDDKKWVAGTVTQVTTANAIVCEFPEPDHESTVEIVLHTPEVKRFYQQNELITA